MISVVNHTLIHLFSAFYLAPILVVLFPHHLFCYCFGFINPSWEGNACFLCDLVNWKLFPFLLFFILQRYVILVHLFVIKTTLMALSFFWEKIQQKKSWAVRKLVSVFPYFQLGDHRYCRHTPNDWEGLLCFLICPRQEMINLFEKWLRLVLTLSQISFLVFVRFCCTYRGLILWYNRF